MGALIINSNDEILLVKSHKWIEKKWTVPGGHIELGETAHDAIIREVKEETNLDELWYNDLVAKISQITHPKAGEKW